MKAKLQTGIQMNCRVQIFDDYTTSQSVISKRSDLVFFRPERLCEFEIQV